MARVPVRRRGQGVAWWVWLIIALAILALIWLAVSLWRSRGAADGDAVDPAALQASPNAAATTDGLASPGADASAPLITDTLQTPATSPATTDGTAPVASGTETIFDLLTVVNRPDQPTLAGRPVQFENVQIQRTTGDQSLFVGPSADQELLVVPSETLTQSASDLLTNLQPGQAVTVVGSLQPLPGFAPLDGQQVYVQADQIVLPSTSNVVFDMLEVVNAPDQMAYVGRPVQFPDVRIQQVTGDQAFEIGPLPDPTLLVVLNEGRNDIAIGQDVTVVGEVRAFPGMAQFDNRRVYIFAERIENITTP